METKTAKYVNRVSKYFITYLGYSNEVGRLMLKNWPVIIFVPYRQEDR